MIRQRNHCEIVHTTVGTERAKRFVFRTAIARIDLVGTVFDLHHTLAFDHAGVAGIAFLQNRFRHLLAADRFAALELTFRIIAGRQRADGVVEQNHNRRTELGETVHIAVFRQGFRTDAVQRSQRFLVSQRYAFRPAHHNRLQILGCHHQAHASASIMAVRHRNQRREQHTVLRADAVLQDLSLRVNFLVQNIIHFPRKLAHQMRRIAQFGLAFNDRQINRLG